MTECPKHAGVEAIGTCTRCGRFMCAAEAKRIDGTSFCEDCAARDEVDWLGKHYAKFERKRSGLVWFMLVIGVPLMALGVTMIISGEQWSERFFGLAVTTWGAACASVFSGRAVTRFAPMAAAFIVGLFVFLAFESMTAVVLTTVSLCLFALMPITDLRTKLFFGVAVSRGHLATNYARYDTNPLAVTASRLAFVSLLFPGLSLLTLVLGVVALARVNRKAVPPIGNASAAIGAIVFSLFTSALWSVWIRNLLRSL